MAIPLTAVAGAGGPPTPRDPQTQKFNPRFCQAEPRPLHPAPLGPRGTCGLGAGGPDGHSHTCSETFWAETCCHVSQGVTSSVEGELSQTDGDTETLAATREGHEQTAAKDHTQLAATFPLL